MNAKTLVPTRAPTTASSAPAAPPARKATAGEIEMGKGAPPPRKTHSRDLDGPVYAEAVKLEPGGWMVWKTAPKSFTSKVRKWAKLSGLPLVAFTDVDGRAIVEHQKLAETPPEDE